MGRDQLTASLSSRDALFEDSFLEKTSKVPSSLVEKIEKEIAEEAGVFSSRKAPSKVKVALDDDLFGSPPKPSQKKDTGTE